jgi:hypothetical protein
MRPVDGASRLERPAWAIALVAAPLAFGLFRGPALIDDAYITFRYAENLAAGRGFVFNADPLLGATAPLYTLLLAALRAAGLAPTLAAFAIGVLAAAAAPVLLWRIGIAAGRPFAGLVGGFLLALMPDWWLNAKTGMETTLAGALLCLAAWLDLRGREKTAGLASAALVLTRPDAAGFPVLVATKLGLVDRRPARALRFAACVVAGLVPWIAYSIHAFDSPLPQSLAAKRLIHPLPLADALTRNFGWLTGVREGSGGMLLLAVLVVAGVVVAARSCRAVLPFVAWPVVSLAALSLLQIGPFFWYRIPLLPAIAFGAALGFEALRDLALRARLPTVAAAAWLLPAAIVVALVAKTGSWVWTPVNLLSVHAKEAAMADMAGAIRDRARAAGRDPATLTLYVGEVGVIGYSLLEARVIDSSGINSKEVYDLRKRDSERLHAANPGAPWYAFSEQSPDWSRAVVDTYSPDFIATDDRYLHLPELSQEAAFRALYNPVQRWSFPNGVTLVLLERRPAAAPGG